MDDGGSSRELLDAVLDAFPSPVFVVDGAVHIAEANRAARVRFAGAGDLLNRRLCGDVLGCLHACRGPGPCGQTEHCPSCPVRGSIDAARDSGKATARRVGRMPLGDEDAWFMITVSPLDLPGERLYLLVLEDVSELMHLRQIIPMCANCRKVRDDRNYWESVETYLADHTRISFSHGICPDCMAKLYPEHAPHIPPGGPETPAPDA